LKQYKNTIAATLEQKDAKRKELQILIN